MANLIQLAPQYFPKSSEGRPVGSGKVYIGTPDTDPTVTANQKVVQALQENGTFVNMTQPISLSAGGIPLLSGSPVSIYTNGDYAMTVQDANSAQIYYVPSVSIPLAPGNYYYPDPAEADQGVAGSGSTIKTYVDAIGTTNKATIYFRHSGTGEFTTYTLTTSEAISSNISLEFEQGAVIDGAGTLTLTVPGSVKAGKETKIFGSSITVTGLNESYIEWWGTTPAAMTAASAAAKVVYMLGAYSWTSTSTMSSSTTVDGKGQGSIAGGATADINFFTGDTVSNIIIKNLKFSATADPPTGQAISMVDVTTLKVLNNVCDDIELLIVEEGDGFGVQTLSDDILVDGNTIVNTLTNTGTEDVKIFYAKNVVITNNYTSGWAQHLYVFGGNSNSNAESSQPTSFNARNIVISNNVVTMAATKAGIALSQVDNAVVSGNVLRGGDDAAIWTGSSKGVTIANNTLTDVTEAITFFGWAEDYVISNNTVEIGSGGGSAIRYYGAGSYTATLETAITENTGPFLVVGNSFSGNGTTTSAANFYYVGQLKVHNNQFNDVFLSLGNHSQLMVSGNTIHIGVTNAASDAMIETSIPTTITGIDGPKFFIINNHLIHDADISEAGIFLNGTPETNAIFAEISGNYISVASNRNSIRIGGDYSSIIGTYLIKDNTLTGRVDTVASVTDATNFRVTFTRNINTDGTPYFTDLQYSTGISSYTPGNPGELIHGTYNFADNGGAITAHALSQIPDNSTIIEAYYEVITSPTATTPGNATISFGVTSDDISGLLVGIADNNAGLDAGYFDFLPDGNAANFTTKTTAARTVVMTVAGDTLTNGKIRIWFRYITSE